MIHFKFTRTEVIDLLRSKQISLKDSGCLIDFAFTHLMIVLLAADRSKD
ncbi:hypothetical protein [Leptospira noguchii]|nr:hypothetical protein [Leptospira noguchii]